MTTTQVIENIAIVNLAVLDGAVNLDFLTFEVKLFDHHTNDIITVHVSSKLPPSEEQIRAWVDSKYESMQISIMTIGETPMSTLEV